jgi:hypothetical protein
MTYRPERPLDLRWIDEMHERHKVEDKHADIERASLRRDRRALWCLTAVFLAVWSLFPAPFGFTYLVKRAIYTPTAECRDGIYSFSSTRSGTCSNHNGVRRWIYTPEQQARDEAEWGNEGDVPHPME